MGALPAPEPFGRLLRRCRLAAGLTQDALADRAGLSARGIQNLEHDVRHPYPDTLARLVVALALEGEERARFEQAGRADQRRAALLGAGPAPDAGPPHNLPVPLTSLIGRDQELVELERTLQRTRLLTLTGVGGCGKTRLALELATRALDAKPDGVWFVELAPLGDPALVPKTTAAVLGLVEQPGQPITQTLTTYLRRQHALLVLDNCEHLLDACARLADALLRYCPGVRILATSREALGITGETPRRVPSLSVPDPSEPPSPERLTGCAAVRMFLERSQMVQPSFQLTDQNAAAIAQVCRRLDGLPLALELAAGRLQGLSVEQLAARLDQQFRLLTGGSRTALPRQQTLRAAIDWSYDLLSEPERGLFGRLSVFAGGWTLEGAEAVGAGIAGEAIEGDDGLDALPRDDVLDVLLRLVARSMVIAEETGDGEERYRLLEPLRQYGRERLLASGEGEAVSQRHAAFYLALAEEAEVELRGPGQVTWLGTLETEYDNLRAALGWLLETDQTQEGMRLGAALGDFWYWRGHMLEGQAWLGRLLALPEAEARTAARAKALVVAGACAANQGDSALGRTWLEEGLAIGRQLGDGWLVALALAWVTNVMRNQHQTTTARLLAEERLAIYRALGDRWGMASALVQLGDMQQQQGELRVAVATVTESLALARRVGDRWVAGLALESLGTMAVLTGDDGAAQRRWEEAHALWAELGEQNGLATTHNRLGGLACRRGDVSLAWTHYAASLAITRRIGGREWVSQTLQGLAALAADQGQPVRALRLAGASAKLHERSGSGPAPMRPDEIERPLALARAALDEATAAAAWEAGQAMTLDQAIDYALADQPA